MTSAINEGLSYLAALRERLRREFEERRRTDREREDRILNGSNNNETTDAGRGNRSGPDRYSSQLPLRIGDVHWYIKDNAANHKTLKFELVEKNTPILRRGQTFFLAIRISGRSFREGHDDLTLTFNFGPHPSPIEGTQQILRVKKNVGTKKDGWYAQLFGHDANAITVQVRIGADAMVGIWRCQVKSDLVQNSGRAQVHQCPEDIYILFNPWERTDGTYMPDQDLLEEYILNDKGKIWVGSHNSAVGRPWNFAQFDDSVLPCVMLLLESSVKARSRGNPILVTRALSKMVNSNDDRGILVGNWSGKYEDGKAPSAWTGSLAIIEDYFEKWNLHGTPMPVKYAQCWVFAGVLATCCRAIGIPCRVVTNFESAHDANETLTIDRYYDSGNKELSHDPFNPRSKDSIWNFHVWNDVWMARPDLEANGRKGYGGWQAIDATPQETSEGVFQCGPASLEAVRKGQIGLSYDVPFVLAEVNADLVHWKEDREARRGWRRMNADKFSIGRMILTKQPNKFDPDGDGDRMDVLEDYKGREGSRVERLALYNAITGKPEIASFYGRLGKQEPSDVKFELLDLDKIPVGDPFNLVVKIENQAKETRTVQATISVTSMYYTGSKAADIKVANGKFTLRPSSKEELKLNVTSEDYMKRLVEYGIMKASVICAVDETTQSWIAEDDFQIIKPCLKLEVKPELKVSQPAAVKINFENPLDIILTKCSINYEGPGLVRVRTIPQKDVPALEEFHHEVQFVPKVIGSQRIVITFTSDELTDIIGSAIVNIKP